MHIDSCLNLKSDLDERKKRRKQLRRQLWLIRAHKLSGRARLQVWHALHRAKWSYAAELLTPVCKAFRAWLKSQWFQALKLVAGIKFPVNMD